MGIPPFIGFVHKRFFVLAITLVVLAVDHQPLVFQNSLSSAAKIIDISLTSRLFLFSRLLLGFD
jgi:hypothetical protein